MRHRTISHQRMLYRTGYWRLASMDPGLLAKTRRALRALDNSATNPDGLAFGRPVVCRCGCGMWYVRVFPVGPGYRAWRWLARAARWLHG